MIAKQIGLTLWLSGNLTAKKDILLERNDFFLENCNIKQMKCQESVICHTAVATWLHTHSEGENLKALLTQYLLISPPKKHKRHENERCKN